MRVLLVEDHADTRELLVAFLSGHGCTVETGHRPAGHRSCPRLATGRHRSRHAASGDGRVGRGPPPPHQPHDASDPHSGRFRPRLPARRAPSAGSGLQRVLRQTVPSPRSAGHPPPTCRSRRPQDVRWLKCWRRAPDASARTMHALTMRAYIGVRPPSARCDCGPRPLGAVLATR